MLEETRAQSSKLTGRFSTATGTLDLPLENENVVHLDCVLGIAYLGP